MNGGYVLKPERTWLPPLGCPRQADGGIGPRLCSVTTCKQHLQGTSTRGPVSPRRVRLMLAQPNHCTLDVVDQADAEAHDMTYAEIGALMGVSVEAVRQSFLTARAKLLRAMGVPTPLHDKRRKNIVANPTEGKRASRR